MVSTFGRTSLSPYSDDDDANTNRWTPAARAAIRRFSVPFTLTALLFSGSSMERGTEGIAA